MGCEGLWPLRLWCAEDDCPVWTRRCLAEAGWRFSHPGGLTLGQSWCAGAGSRVRRNMGGALAAHPSRAVRIRVDRGRACGLGRVWASSSVG